METLQELEQKEKSFYLLSIGIAIPAIIDAGYLLFKHIHSGLLFYTFLALAGLFAVVALKLNFLYGQEDELKKGDGENGIQ